MRPGLPIMARYCLAMAGMRPSILARSIIRLIANANDSGSHLCNMFD
jgi:hypothetical protein